MRGADVVPRWAWKYSFAINPVRTAVLNAVHVGPLAGVRILEFGSFVAAPFAGQLLSDMGADVIKIESPTGDPWRQHIPIEPNEGRSFLSLNRGKRSVCLDLTKPHERVMCHKLVQSADAVIVNNRPATSRKLGIDYETLSAVQPRLVYCEITGFGPYGPSSDRPGFDLIMQGYSGIMASEGRQENNQPISVTSTPVIDFSAGYAASNAVASGLFARERSGRGQKISTSLLANAVAIQSMVAIHIDQAPSQARKWLNGRGRNLMTNGSTYQQLQDEYQKARRDSSGGSAVSPVFRTYYRAYRTKDSAIAIGALANKFRINLLRVLGLTDPRVQEEQYDDSTLEALRAGDKLVAAMENAFAGRMTADWVELLRNNNVPCEPVRFVEELLEDEQAIANGYMVELDHPVVGKYRTSGPVWHFENDRAASNTRTSPSLGADTRKILAEAGFSNDDIGTLSWANSRIT